MRAVIKGAAGIVGWVAGAGIAPGAADAAGWVRSGRGDLDQEASALLAEVGAGGGEFVANGALSFHVRRLSCFYLAW